MPRSLNGEMEKILKTISRHIQLPIELHSHKQERKKWLVSLWEYLVSHCSCGLTHVYCKLELFSNVIVVLMLLLGNWVILSLLI